MKASNGLKVCPVLSRTLVSRRVCHFISSLLSCLPFLDLRRQAFDVMSLEMLPHLLAPRDATPLLDLKTALDDVGEFKLESMV